MSALKLYPLSCCKV